jgi:molecular chaperone DnaK
MTDSGTWVLTVDFGTTNTVAAVADAGGIHTLTIDGRPVMPSSVFLTLDAGGRQSWLVGEAAQHMARRRMEWFEASPKSSIADRTLFLGGQDIPVEDAIAAVFSVVVDEALAQHGGRPPDSFVVTHPATWSDSRVEVLKNAARAATERVRGWPDPMAVSEPEAAAQGGLAIEQLPEHARVVVLDLGGGTVDVTVVDRHGASLTVVGRPSGLESLGGEDFDLRLAQWLTAEAGAPGLFERLATSADTDERERAVDIRRHARAVKEQLSKQPVVPAQLPKSPPELPDSTPVQVSRPQLEELIRGGPGQPAGLVDAVDLVGEALSGAPPGPPAVGVLLVGGSSRIPLLGALLQERVHLVPITHGDPTTAVADGAASLAWRWLQAPSGTPPPPVDPPPPPPPPDLPVAPRKSRASRAAALVVLAVLVLGIGGGIVYASTQGDGDTPPLPPASSFDAQPRSSDPPSPPPDPTVPSPPVALTLDDCLALYETGCDDTVLGASADVWPAMAGASNCSVHDSLFGDDLFYVECSSGSLSYVVFWRDPGSAGTPLADTVGALMASPSYVDFTLSNDPGTVLGLLVKGWRGPVYDCLWEYANYPVAMLVEGPDGNTTDAACVAAQFYDEVNLESALAGW